MIDLLSGTNITLFILALGYLCFVLKYQYVTRDDVKSLKLSRYIWSVSTAAVAILIGSFSFLLYDLHFIRLTTQRDLSIIPRLLLVAHLIIAFSTIEWRKGSFIVPIAVILGIIIFIVRKLY